MKQERDESYSHVLKYTGVFGGVQGLNVVIGLVRNKFVAVLLGPGGMGLVSLFNTTVQLISQATHLGISFSAVRHISEYYDAGETEKAAHYVKVVRGWCLLTALLGMLVCIVLGPLLSNTTFAWGNHTLHFVLLAPAIGMIAITGGETAILKGQRKLGALALVQITAALASLAVSIPIYYFFWQAGIVPVIVLMAFVTMCILGEGMDMVRLGVAFTLAGVVGSAAEMVVRSYLNVVADLDVLGLYNAGFMLTITYAGMVFSAMETDYFPRLSGVNRDVEQTNYTVNRQMEVSLLIIAPMLTALIALLPILIPQLFTSEFIPVIPMAQVTALAMFFKVLTLPVAYITLARGYSMTYLMLEAAYYVIFVLFIVLGYQHWGLLGTGIAITLAHVFDYLMINLYAYKKYGYRVSATVSRYAIVLFALGFLAYACTILLDGIVYWVVEFFVVLASGLYSLQILRQKTHLWQALTRRFRKG